VALELIEGEREGLREKGGERRDEGGRPAPPHAALYTQVTLELIEGEKEREGREREER
jgi:hypothetical protein